MYEASDKDMEGYSDADWAVDSEDRRSTSGNVFIMSNGAISWASQKQPTVALSTAEAKYIALCLATKESVWLRQLCKDLQILFRQKLFRSNQYSRGQSRDNRDV